MPEKLRRWFADFNDGLGRAMLLRYGGGAFVSQLPRRLEQDIRAPSESSRLLSSPAHAGVASIDHLVRQLDGG